MTNARDEYADRARCIETWLGYLDAEDAVVVRDIRDIMAEHKQMRELLQRSAEALMNCAKAALTVKPSIDKPYPDAPEWTPWKRFVEAPSRRAHDLAVEIRKCLRAEAEEPKL